MNTAASMDLTGRAGTVQDAARIPPVTRAEARALAEAEVGRFLALVESLGPDDWARPTVCTEWNVRQMLAHQAGAYAGYASWGEFGRQMLKPPARGQLMEDALSARQVTARADRTPAELIAELRSVYKRAIANRQRLPGLLRALGMPHPAAGVLRFGHLLDEIYTRDTWMHRLDIARATGRPMALTADHDGRIVALVIRDLAQMLGPKLGRQAVVLVLTGTAGGTWRLGDLAATASATVTMDVLDFNILASGRYSVEEGFEKARVEGDQALGKRMLRESKVLY